ncbi:hypothetical protein JKP88DRAFT_245627 [Tribonema minus]|uniref:Bestrophin homolog n=1 Tax=Tribonema minus TaxID=303371 RepID=A0A835YZV0_9STRA|nr:hypothetical protein JKP88DRAFT_245627 [Tribonema minus]
MSSGNSITWNSEAPAMATSQKPRERSIGKLDNAVLRRKHLAMNFAKAIGFIEGPQSIHAFSFHGTILEILMYDVKLYVYIGWMLFWLILRHAGVITPEAIPDVASRYIGYSQAVLSFLLVFFLNSTYTEFKDMGRAAVGGPTPASTAAVMVKVFFKDDPHLQERVIRLINASHYLSWMDLCKYYSWIELEERGLLTKEEIAVIRVSEGAKKFRVPMVWAVEELAAYARKQDEILEDWLDLPREKRVGRRPAVLDKFLMTRIIDYINDGRTSFNGQFIQRGVLVPELYTHMVFWLMTVVLLVLGVYAGIGTEADVDEVSNQSWWIGGYMVVVVSFLGVFDVAIALREPFGLDAGLDIDPLVFVESTIVGHKALLKLPTMLGSEQTCRPTYDLWQRSKTAEGHADFIPPARGAAYTSSYSFPVNQEMREMLSSRLPKDEDGPLLGAAAEERASSA